MTKQRADLTFKANVYNGRHGWLRLTPAYSVKVVHQILDNHPHIASVLDPFSGTGTTGLVAAERGLYSGLVDVNPFLVWLAQVKTENYLAAELDEALECAETIVDVAKSYSGNDTLWIPPISNVERWWSPHRLTVFSQLYAALTGIYPTSSKVKDVLLLAFCQLAIDWSNAAFNHQSMSFQDKAHVVDSHEENLMYPAFLKSIGDIVSVAREGIPGRVDVFKADSRDLNGKIRQQYDSIITSPPYANRMSYIRELRPYMFWLGYLAKARDAGELDWEAIGGTWGIATSRLIDWRPNGNYQSDSLLKIVNDIAGSSDILANYVHKYIEDMFTHFCSIRQVLKPGAKVFYIVGNSKFYDTLVPVQELYADMLARIGFDTIEIAVVRKRNSKKELFEYLVSATYP